MPASFSASAYASFFFAPSSDAARLDASLGDVPASIISFSASSKPAPVDLSDSFRRRRGTLHDERDLAAGLARLELGDRLGQRPPPELLVNLRVGGRGVTSGQ